MTSKQHVGMKLQMKLRRQFREVKLSDLKFPRVASNFFHVYPACTFETEVSRHLGSVYFGSNT